MTDDLKELDPATFDLDGWLAGVKRPRAHVTVYARGDLMPHIDELVADLEAALKRAKSDDGADVPLAELGYANADAEQIRADLKAVWEEYEASGLTLELEQISSMELEGIEDRVAAELPDLGEDASPADELKLRKARDEAQGYHLVSASIVAAGPYGKDRASIVMTVDQVRTLAARFGPDQVNELAGQAYRLTFEGQVSVPFSRRVSAMLTGTTSG